MKTPVSKSHKIMRPAFTLFLSLVVGAETNVTRVENRRLNAQRQLDPLAFAISVPESAGVGASRIGSKPLSFTYTSSSLTTLLRRFERRWIDRHDLRRGEHTKWEPYVESMPNCHHLEAGESSGDYPLVLPKSVFSYGDDHRLRPLRVLFIMGLDGSGHRLMAKVFQDCKRDAERMTGGFPLCRNPFGALFFRGRHTEGLMAASSEHPREEVITETIRARSDSSPLSTSAAAALQFAATVASLEADGDDDDRHGKDGGEEKSSRSEHGVRTNGEWGKAVMRLEIPRIVASIREVMDRERQIGGGLLLLNVGGGGSAGEGTYPNFGNSGDACRSLKIPDVRLMAEIFEMEGVDFRVLVLVRNSRDTLLSMLSQRGFVRDFERAANMSESILRRDMLQNQLHRLDPRFYACLDYDRLPDFVPAWLGRFLGLDGHPLHLESAASQPAWPRRAVGLWGTPEQRRQQALQRKRRSDAALALGGTWDLKSALRRHAAKRRHGGQAVEALRQRYFLPDEGVAESSWGTDPGPLVNQSVVWSAESRTWRTDALPEATRRRLLVLSDLEREALQRRSARRESARRAALRKERLNLNLLKTPRAPFPVDLEKQLQSLRRLCAKNEEDIDYWDV